MRVVDNQSAAGLGSTYVLLLRWAEMKQYADAHDITWPTSSNKSAALDEFSRIYRQAGLDKGVFPVTAGQDWGINEHTPPPQLAWYDLVLNRGLLVCLFLRLHPSQNLR
eukprot:COSAG01_NODE_3979_length_5471_cov_3.013217_6_plen_109_part_00